jgi:hypothetical protein
MGRLGWWQVDGMALQMPGGGGPDGGVTGRDQSSNRAFSKPSAARARS